MQVKTIWQPSYTPAPQVPHIPMRRNHDACNPRRAYLSFGQSKTAQKVLKLIETHDGVSVGDLITKSKLQGAGQYVKTLEQDGYIVCKMRRVPAVRQSVKHYWSAYE